MTEETNLRYALKQYFDTMFGVHKYDPIIIEDLIVIIQQNYIRRER